MAVTPKKGYITPRDLLLRESALCDYLQSWIVQAESCVNVILLNYNTSFIPLCSWATCLASLAHRIEERSLLLASMAQRDSNPMLGRKMNYYSATAICLQLLEEKNSRASLVSQVEELDRPV